MIFSPVSYRKLFAILAVLTVLVSTGTAGVVVKRYGKQTLQGTVESGGNGLSGYRVSLYASHASRVGGWRKLGTQMVDDSGKFSIHYRLPHAIPKRAQPLLFVLAEKGLVTLANAMGQGPLWGGHVVINERTTVAAGTAFAQFIQGREIHGNKYGMLNAMQIAADMASPETGDVGAVLARTPNGSDNSTLATFNTLANIVADCVASVEDGGDCSTLLDTAVAPDGTPAANTLDAVANMTKNPSRDMDTLFGLATLATVVYTPALTSAPASWLLFIKFTGGNYVDYDSTNLMNGPGQVAIDKRGNFWINDNYVPVNPIPEDFDLDDFLNTPPTVLPDYVACAGKRLLKFHPWGEPYADMSDVGYTGGGLSGAGFGITLDPHGDVWVGNFGFEAPLCTDFPALAAPHDSVSQFHPDGTPVSGPDGFAVGRIWWPQATMSDRRGNIWLANCGNDTVTKIPNGHPWLADNIALPGGLGADGHFAPVYDKDDPDTQPRLKPFAITFDPKGRVWVTGNLATGDPDASGIGAVYRISPDGTVENIPNTQTNDDDVEDDALFSRPMGIVSDSKGNIWVSNSDAVDIPCVGPFKRHGGGDPSVAYISADGKTRRTFRHGGITIPWGSAIDGNDQLWVFNFNSHIEEDSGDFQYPMTALSRFCGSGRCPAGKQLGDAISPDDTGYASNALDRMTGGAFGPSGALVLLNNWKKPGPRPIYYRTSPGGNSFVIIPGAGAPIRTPLIGAPRSFNNSHKSVRNHAHALPYLLHRRGIRARSER